MTKTQGRAVLEAFARRELPAEVCSEKELTKYFKKNPEKIQDLLSIMNRMPFESVYVKIEAK